MKRAAVVAAALVVRHVAEEPLNLRDRRLFPDTRLKPCAMDACARAIAADGAVTDSETVLLRAIALRIGARPPRAATEDARGQDA